MSELSFDTNSVFEEIQYDPPSDSWAFKFSGAISFVISGFWRLLSDGKIILVSLDHGRQFGMPVPTDMTLEIADRLRGKTLIRIQVVKDTGDLKLFFNGNLELECLITSTGYESYNFTIYGKQYIAIGGGDIAIF